MQGLSREQDLKTSQLLDEKLVNEGLLFSCYNTCESFIKPERSVDSSQSTTRKQTYSATPYRDPFAAKSQSSKNKPATFSPRPAQDVIQKFKSFQGESCQPPMSNQFYPKKKFQPSSKLHLVKASLPPLNPNKQSSLSNFNPLNLCIPNNTSASLQTSKGKLESLELSTSNPLLEELDRQHEAFKLSVEAIRASLSGISK